MNEADCFQIEVAKGRHEIGLFNCRLPPVEAQPQLVLQRARLWDDGVQGRRCELVKVLQVTAGVFLGGTGTAVTAVEVKKCLMKCGVEDKAGNPRQHAFLWQFGHA